MKSKSDHSATPKWILHLFPVIFVLAGAIILFFAVRSTLKIKASKSWPTAEAMIEHSEVKEEIDYDSPTRYYADVKYSYSVDGKNYTSERIAPGGRFYSEDPDDAQKLVDENPVGNTSTIAYDPVDPSYSVLDTEVSSGNWLLYLVGIPFFLVGILLWIVLPKLFG